MAALYKLHSKRPKDDSHKISQKVLILSSRGITARQRFLINDLTSLIPHSKKDGKLDTKTKLYELNELADLSNCNNILFFEARKHADLYMHLAKSPNGPKIKMLVQNIHTMDELNMTGNCLKGSRPILSFSGFESSHGKVMREVLEHVFQVPKGARRSKPFIDHVITFTIHDGKIWFRNYQIQDSDSPKTKSKSPSNSTKVDIKEGGVVEDGMKLIEIGPRFCMTPIHIIEGSFQGPVIYENRHFVHPNQVRRLERLSGAEKYKSRLRAMEDQKVKKSALKRQKGELDNDVLFA